LKYYISIAVDFESELFEYVPLASVEHYCTIQWYFIVP